MLVIQCAAFFLFRRLAYRAPPKSFGVVRDVKQNIPLPGAVVRVFETTYNKLLETQVTDRLGRYAFLVGPSRYYVTVEKAGYALLRSEVIDLTQAGSEAVVAQDVGLVAAAGPAVKQAPQPRPTKTGPVVQ